MELLERAKRGEKARRSRSMMGDFGMAEGVEERRGG